jgi:hypothetical protein
LPVSVALNRFGGDTERGFEMIRKHLGERGVEALVCEHFAKGSKGATNLAKSMVKLIDQKPGSPTFAYDAADELWKKDGQGREKIQVGLSVRGVLWRVRTALRTWSRSLGWPRVGHWPFTFPVHSGLSANQSSCSARFRAMMRHITDLCAVPQGSCLGRIQS